MSSDFEMLLGQVRSQREMLFKLVTGLKPDQWNFQPYSHLNSIHSTLVHLLIVDRATVVKVEDGMSFDWDSMVTDQERNASPDELITLLKTSLSNVIQFLETNFGSKTLDAPFLMFGSTKPVGAAICSLSEEYAYHNGQVSYLRQASDTDWDYYTALYS